MYLTWLSLSYAPTPLHFSYYALIPAHRYSDTHRYSGLTYRYYSDLDMSNLPNRVSEYFKRTHPGLFGDIAKQTTANRIAELLFRRNRHTKPDPNEPTALQQAENLLARYQGRLEEQDAYQARLEERFAHSQDRLEEQSANFARSQGRLEERNANLEAENLNLKAKLAEKSK